jgi:hypothetical protein
MTCPHLTGYWIQFRWTFRCYKCGCQFCIQEIAPHKGRRIETWQWETSDRALAVEDAVHAIATAEQRYRKGGAS